MSSQAVDLAAGTAAAVAQASGTVAASAAATAAADNGTLAAQVFWATVRWLPGSLYWLITFVSITLPSWMFTVFSTTLTFSLNATTVLLIFLAFASSVSWLIRYRIMTTYSRLPPEPQRKDPTMDLFTHAGDGETTKPGLANYLDEFLSAIKVFGYLERPVFHELTRTMQTRKLIAGETLLLEEEKGFCIVVDGTVQIFVKSDRDEGALRDLSEPPAGAHGHSHEDEERRSGGRQGYQLLTEVKNGAAMSSLFSVLSLFTEDIKLRHDEDDDEQTAAGNARGRGVSPLDRPASAHGGPYTNDRGTDMYAGHRHISPVPHMSLDSSRSEHAEDANVLSPVDGFHHATAAKQASRAKSAHPNIVARATIDTTIAIIPASAFRRLTRVYPKATSHIVQVILSRLQRVTLATAHSYLGLTDDVLMIEKNMNKYTAYDIPNHLRGNALERLKGKFQREKERLTSAEDGMKGIALHNPNAARRRPSTSSVRKDLLAKIQLAQARSATQAPPSDHAPSMDQRSNVSPGDLLAGVPPSRVASHHPTFSLGRIDSSMFTASDPTREATSPLAIRERSPFAPSPRLALTRQESLDEDDLFRESIMSCMSKAIGLSNLRTGPNKVESAEQSPRLVSFDRRSQMATFSNAFGFMDPYDGPTEADSDSVVSASGASAAASFVSPETMNQEIRNDLEIVYFPKGAVLVEQGERNPGLYYVLDGFLDVSYLVEEKSVLPADEQNTATSSQLFGNGHTAPSERDPVGRRQSMQAVPGKSKGKQFNRKTVFLIKPGGLAGYIGTVSSHRSFVDIRAKTDVYVGFLPRASLERFVEKYPVVLLTMAKRLTTLLPRLMLHIDFALEWVQVNAGEVIHHQGDESDAIYIVLNGRLRSIAGKSEQEMRVVAEYGQGESVGELEVMTESERPATLLAIRDTEVAKFPKTLFNSLALEHPGITMKISKIIAQRMRTLIEDPMSEHVGEKRALAQPRNATSSLNLRTIAILPVTAGVPVVDFGTRLLNALTQIGVPNGVTSLNHAAIMNHLGRHAFSKMGKLKLSQYLADLEEQYGMLLYIADTSVNSPWTQTCISQADCILLIGLAEASPAIGEFEKFLLGMKTTARKELVLLHTDRYSPPGLTRKWLQNRLWINGGHHHIQMAFQAPTEPANPQGRRFGAALKQRVQVLQAEIQKYTSRRIHQTPLYNSDTPFKGDFHRLARNLCGRSVGLVLGGGGARGIAHIGIIRALEEADVPIDIVGGTSIGAFVGALYAREGDVVPMYGRAKRFGGRMGSVWRFALDLTYPSISYTTGHEFNRGIFKTFGDSQIEDFWLPFYCNTTNITKSRLEIHNSGYVWRYVRASMSLAGLFPPLCDEGNMLLDGGYVDNLTVSHMKSLGADVVFAIDVGSAEDDTPHTFGDSLSGAWALVNRWNPFSSQPNPPTLSEIQARLAYVSSVDALERAKHMPGCVYMRPPIDPYGTLEFAKFDEIYDVGYKYGTAFLADLRGQGILPNMEETEEKKKLRRTMAPRRASI